MTLPDSRQRGARAARARPRRWLVLVVALAWWGVVTGPGARATESPAPAAPSPDARDAVSENTFTYRMSGKVRLLLFWVGRDGVGEGRLVRRRGANGTSGHDLLVGTDPRVAPRRLNRWGYIAETREGADGAVLALMSRSDEVSLDDVRERDGQGSAQFRALAARVSGGTAVSCAPLLSVDGDPTIHDLRTLLAQVQEASSRAPTRRIAVPPGVRPGFLAAVADLVDASVDGFARHRDEPRVPLPAPVSYVYGVRLYDLRLQAHTRVAPPAFAAVTGEAVRGRFEIRNRTTADVTRFELVYGIDGPLAGVPLLIVYQPRWWLKVELRLEPGAVMSSPPTETARQ